MASSKYGAVVDKVTNAETLHRSGTCINWTGHILRHESLGRLRGRKQPQRNTTSGIHVANIARPKRPTTKETGRGQEGGWTQIFGLTAQKT